MNSRHFYEELHVISSFREVANHSLYTPIPDSWYLALADIRGSTDAIRLGKYKEVNLAGASIIAALNNLFEKENMLPYLFGGDGSLIALPDEKIEAVKGTLAFCKDAVKKAYGLEMATGVVSMRSLREDGYEIKAARFRLSEIIDQTLFWGDGVTYAENLIKKENLLEDVEPVEADFSGLECRWNKVPSDKDEVAAYIIQAVGGTDEDQVNSYEQCFEEIEKIYGTEDEYHPIREEALNMSLNPLQLSAEWKLRTQPSSLTKKVKHAALMAFQYATGVYLMKFNKQTSATNWGDYKPDLVRHADYQKFGDGLRFVAAGTIQQRMDFTHFLDQQFKAGKIAYGVHSSFAAMVTCYVKNYQSNHIHFVDGTDGGYAKASQELKARRKQLGM
ncbi:DUF3095 family protein [Gracilimonas mengyeensis]|uniref:DUF3095 domain-containing protein n=1 Tax=Gracilimonas mengyeensis TaxID=1302730 RepID=A0A521BGA8_9BACT|nr:DUF3095 family protein [Gracilimonas mengyeensis]SMO46128.1 Protein of unknown function [Gracilimonas mengyeensis]